ncbi:MAG: histidine phosphatase family protein [Bacillota bacterium]
MIRHGTTLANQEGRFQGRLDYPLSTQGRREAALLGCRIKDLAPEVLLSSDLKRAWETAQIIARAAGLVPKPLPLLRECSWGAIEGLTLCEIKSLYPDLIPEGSVRIKAAVFGGESEKMLLARAIVLLRFLGRRCNRRQRILLVSHGRFINALFAACLGYSAKQRWPFAPAPASLSMISCSDNRQSYRLELFNDRCHLSG